MSQNVREAWYLSVTVNLKVNLEMTNRRVALKISKKFDWTNGRLC